MDGKTQIVVAVIGLVGVLGAALIGSGALSSRPDRRTAAAVETSGPQFSTTCRFLTGPRAGETIFFPPDTPGLIPVVVGAPCNDGAGSIGVGVPD